MIIRIKKSSVNRVFEIIIFSFLINPLIYNSRADIQRYMHYIFLVGYMLLNSKELFNLINTFVNRLSLSVLGLLVWLLWAVLVPFVNGTSEFSFLYTIWYGVSSLIYILPIAIFITKKVKTKEVLEEFCYIYSCAMALYVIASIIIIIVPGLREFMIDYFVINDRDRFLLTYKQYYTRIGWSGIAAYGTALKTVTAFAFSMYLLFINSSNRKKTIKLGVVSGLLLLGNILYARTGMLACLGIISIYVLNLAKYRNKLKEVLKICAIGLLVIAVLIYVIYTYRDNAAIGWMFEAVYNFLEKGVFTSGSTEHLTTKMLFMPSWETLLTGDGMYTYNGAYYMLTDLGFMRLTLYGGVFFCAYIYIWMIFLLKKIGDKNKKHKLLGYNLLLMFIVFEIKGESTITLIPLFILLIVLVYVNLNRGIGATNE